MASNNRILIDRPSFFHEPLLFLLIKSPSELRIFYQYRDHLPDRCITSHPPRTNIDFPSRGQPKIRFDRLLTMIWENRLEHIGHSNPHHSKCKIGFDAYCKGPNGCGSMLELLQPANMAKVLDYFQVHLPRRCHCDFGENLQFRGTTSESDRDHENGLHKASLRC